MHPRNTFTARIMTSLAMLISVFCTGGPKRMQAQANSEEYQIKAAFIFHFAQLVDWPEAASDSVAICTLGTDPFQGALERTVAGKAIGNRTIQVRHLKQVEETTGCHILFLSKSQTKQIPVLLADLHNAPVLTVGETPGFLGAGGMICFVLQDNNVRFQINLDAARSAGLKIGSRLLVLAQSVVGDTRAR